MECYVKIKYSEQLFQLFKNVIKCFSFFPFTLEKKLFYN